MLVCMAAPLTTYSGILNIVECHSSGFILRLSFNVF